MVDSRFRNCPKCGSTDLDIDTTPSAEIAGTMFQSCWVECKTCGYYFDFEWEEDQPNKSWDVFVNAWNEIEPT